QSDDLLKVRQYLPKEHFESAVSRIYINTFDETTPHKLATSLAHILPIVSPEQREEICWKILVIVQDAREWRHEWSFALTNVIAHADPELLEQHVLPFVLECDLVEPEVSAYLMIELAKRATDAPRAALIDEAFKALPLPDWPLVQIAALLP